MQLFYRFVRNFSRFADPVSLKLRKGQLQISNGLTEHEINALETLETKLAEPPWVDSSTFACRLYCRFVRMRQKYWLCPATEASWQNKPINCILVLFVKRSQESKWLEGLQMPGSSMGVTSALTVLCLFNYKSNRTYLSHLIWKRLFCSCTGSKMFFPGGFFKMYQMYICLRNSIENFETWQISSTILAIFYLIFLSSTWSVVSARLRSDVFQISTTIRTFFTTHKGDNAFHIA